MTNDEIPNNETGNPGRGIGWNTKSPSQNQLGGIQQSEKQNNQTVSERAVNTRPYKLRGSFDIGYFGIRRLP